MKTNMFFRIFVPIVLACFFATDLYSQDSGGGGRRFGRRDRGGFGGGPGGWFNRGGGGQGGGRSSSRGGDGGFDPAAMMDRNRNGRIDQEEIDRIPDFVRDRLKERGWNLTAGQSVDEYRKQFRQRMEQMREERNRRENGDATDPQANRSTPPTAFRPRDKARITKDLPKKYSEIDSDLDGQIGLYEWVVSRRSDLELFDDIDRDTDGLLTPNELIAWEEQSDEAGKTVLTANERKRLVIVGGSTTSASSSGGETQGGRFGDRTKKEVIERGQRSFGWIDRDADGRVSAEELGNSRRTRSMFQNAGIELTDMSQEQFQKNYMKAYEKAAQRRSERR